MHAIGQARRGRRGGRVGPFALLAALLLTVVVACGDDGGGSSSDGTESVEIVLGWLAEPSRGGLFAAEQQGYFEDAGIDAELTAGTDVSAVQLVGAGQAEFGIGDGDELLAARQEGIPVVALATTFQTNPRILVYHAEHPVEDFEDLDGRTVYLDLGDDWWEYVKGEYGLDDVDERAYTGQLVNFIDDENALVQGYVGSEDVVLEERGVDVGFLNVGESGFDPYTNVLFTTEDYLAEHRDVVEAVVDATIQGWEYYEDGYEEVNEFMQPFNEELTVESMNATAEAQVDFIYGGDAETEGVGYMTLDRWETLAEQLRGLDVLTEDVDVDALVDTEFLS